MALGVWQNTIRDNGGRIAANAVVTVLDSTTSTNRSLFADRDSVTPLSNPVIADADGFVRFYSAIGRVDIQIVAGGRSRLLEDVVLIDDYSA